MLVPVEVGRDGTDRSPDLGVPLLSTAVSGVTAPGLVLSGAGLGVPAVDGRDAVGVFSIDPDTPPCPDDADSAPCAGDAGAPPCPTDPGLPAAFSGPAPPPRDPDPAAPALDPLPVVFIPVVSGYPEPAPLKVGVDSIVFPVSPVFVLSLALLL